MYLASQGLVIPGPSERPHECNTKLAFSEEFVVKAATDVFEHAYRHNAVVDLIEVAIILETKLELARISSIASASARIFELLNGQGHAINQRTATLGEITAEPTPS